MKSYSHWSIYTLFFILSFSTISIAQPINKLIDNVALPDANAISLGKYTDVPVSYYTGVPNISIPIATVEQGSLQLPISLSYHAGGVRVSEVASWVGLGWSLNAGGVITRTVLGKPDEGDQVAQGYWNEASSLAAVNEEDNFQYYPTLGNGSCVGVVCDAAAGRVDSEPDIFSFNFSGYSGKFWIKPNDEFGAPGEVVLIPKQDLKVERLTGNQGSYYGDYHFRITTPDGTKYVFGYVDGTNPATALHLPHTGNSPQPPYATSWYLRKIESADAEHSITLSYVEEGYSYRILAGRTHT